MTTDVILVTGFEPFGAHSANPSDAIAKQLDGQRVGGCRVQTTILPVHHVEAAVRVRALLDEMDPVGVVHLGLAEGRARLALERVALNVLDFVLPDNTGYRAAGEPCVPGGPAAYFATLPLEACLCALKAEGIPVYLSNTAGTYLCNQTLYASLHAIARGRRRARAGFVHLPLSPAMVAASGLDLPSMDLGTMQRGVEIVLRVLAETRRDAASRPPGPRGPRAGPRGGEAKRRRPPRSRERGGRSTRDGGGGGN